MVASANVAAATEDPPCLIPTFALAETASPAMLRHGKAIVDAYMTCIAPRIEEAEADVRDIDARNLHGADRIDDLRAAAARRDTLVAQRDRVLADWRRFSGARP
ncbi:hypothetical protein [Sphingopyxis macrogoltabida]|uniref:Uncharacterized protein n=2 Tax=Sphingopyxis macrogoltabida TaxID=33050 RepID=A0AAC9AW16_SPHMC|nr:hypothetical protein [Sphingopyxis macrogoltabida]AMU90951.1 hypothetical protein ATM17_18200 [Sphingopyxis macrogoltabida]